MKRTHVLILLSIVTLLFVSSYGIADSGTFIDPISTFSTASAKGLGGNQYTEYVGGGRWEHGTQVNLVSIPVKQVYSIYYHETKMHKSSCKIGSNTDSSGWVDATCPSYSGATGGLLEQTQAWWSTDYP